MVYLAVMPKELPEGVSPFDGDPNVKAESADSVALFDVSTGQERRRFPIKDVYVVSVAASPDGRRIAVGISDGSIRFIDLTSGRELRRIDTKSKPLCLKFSPDGASLASGGEQHVSDAERGQPLTIAPFPISLWNVETGTLIRRVPGNPYYVRDVAYSPDGKLLASCGLENAIRLWNVADSTELLATDTPRYPIRSMAISPDAKTLVTGDSFGAIREWNPATGRPRLVGECFVEDMIFMPDGKRLVTYGQDCRLWDVAAGKEVRRYDGYQRGMDHVAVSPDGRTLITGHSLFDIATGTQTTYPSLEDEKNKASYIRPARFLEDGRTLLFVSWSGVQARDADDRGRFLSIVAKPPQYQYEITISPDERLLGIGDDVIANGGEPGQDNSIQLWEMASGQEVARLKAHPCPIRALAFSGDGRWLASGGRWDESNMDHSVRIWDLSALVMSCKLVGHRNNINKLAFSRDGRWLASASDDGTVLIWDTANLARIAPVAPSAPLNLGRTWSDLAGADAAKAHRLIWALAADAERAVPFLAEQLEPIQENDPKKDTSLGPIAKGETLRRLRAISVLEKIGSPEARGVLERLATGLAGARETCDAKAALRRMPL